MLEIIVCYMICAICFLFKGTRWWWSDYLHMVCGWQIIWHTLWRWCLWFENVALCLVLGELKVYKMKERQGVVERLVDDYTVIGRWVSWLANENRALCKQWILSDLVDYLVEVLYDLLVAQQGYSSDWVTRLNWLHFFPLRNKLS